MFIQLLREGLPNILSIIYTQKQNYIAIYVEVGLSVVYKDYMGHPMGKH